MSIQFQKEIFSDGKLKLFINFTGISPDNVTNKNDLSLSVFAINNKTLSHLFSEVLNFDQIQVLYSHLNSVSLIRNNGKTHSTEFVEVTENSADILALIQSVDGNLVKQILNKVDENKKLELVLEALNESDIQNLHASIRQTNHQKSLIDLKLLLELEDNSTITESIKSYENLEKYMAGQSEKIFQNWIENNIWTLGIDYIKKHSARQIGIKSESDLIMETTDGFIDLIELKRPKFELFKFDNSHKCYYPSNELSKVIGQCMEYLKILDNYKLILEKQYKFKLLRPRIKIIVGRTVSFNDEMYEALRMLNSNLNHMEIISYDYLCLCGENIISYYNREIDKSLDLNKKDNSL